MRVRAPQIAQQPVFPFINHNMNTVYALMAINITMPALQGEKVAGVAALGGNLSRCYSTIRPLNPMFSSL